MLAVSGPAGELGAIYRYRMRNLSAPFYHYGAHFDYWFLAPL